MKKFSIGWFLILICFSQVTQSQTYVDLFSEYLPKEYLKHSNKVEQMEISLTQLSRINPDLIYYYLSYLEYITERKIFSRDSNYYNILQYEVSLSSKYNNEWVDKKLDEVDSIHEPELILGELKSLLDDFRVKEQESPKYSVKLNVDKNLQKFFSYKSLVKDTTIIYDPNIDYSEAVKVTIENIISSLKLESVSDQSGKNELDKSSLDFLYQHHIFSKGFCDGYGNSIEFDYLKYLISLIDYSEFKEYAGIIFSFSLEAIQTGFPSENVSEPYLPFKEYTIKQPDNTLLLYDLSVGYRIKFKEFKGAFSYLDVNIGLGYGNKKDKNNVETQKIDKYVFKWEGQPGNFTLLFNGTINSISWEIKNFSSFSSSVNLPVYYLNKNLFFEIGLQYKYLFWESSITVDREIIEQSALDPSILGPEIENFNHKASKQLFSGSLSANYSFSKLFNLKCTFSTIPSLQIGLEYIFTL